MPSESLTLQIAGDSAPLQRELDAVEQRLSSFQSKLTSATDIGRSLDQVASRFGNLARPLEQVGRQLDRIGAQLQNLAQIPVRINIAPALQGLALLSQQIDALAAKLQALAAQRPFVPAPLPDDPGPFRRFAAGGYVTGPAGLDRIPALLSAGEFVIREAAVRELSPSFLQQLNQGIRPAPTAPSHTSTSTSHVTNVGGITLQLTRPTELANVLRDLDYNTFRLRTRRG